MDLTRNHTALALTATGFLLITLGHAAGLFWAPREAMMGDVGRILYAHVPTAWVSLLTYLFAGVCASMALVTTKDKWDAGTHACVEVGLVLNVLLLFQGSVWAKPTWGTYWTFDPRLTTTAIMALSFAGILVLRHLVHDHDRRRVVTSVATILAFVNVPIVYMSVKWWKSLHQTQSSPDTVSDPMVWVLRTAAFGMLFLALGFILLRRDIALRRLQAAHGETDLPDAQDHIELGLKQKGTS